MLGGTTFAYAPELYGGNCTQSGSTGWISTLSVQNVGSSNATITVNYYYQAGGWVSQAVSSPVTPGRRFAFNPTSGNMPPDLCGSAVIQANQPIAAVVNNSHDGSGDTKASYTVPNR